MQQKKVCSFNFLKLFPYYADMRCPCQLMAGKKKKNLQNLQITVPQALPVSNNFFWLEYYHFRNY